MIPAPKAALAAALALGLGAPLAQAHDDDDDRTRGSGRRDTELRAGKSHRPVVVVDSTGREIGRVAPSGTSAAVVLQYRNDTLVVPLSADAPSGQLRSTGLGWGVSYVYYSGLGCTGQRYIPASVFALGGTRSVLPERRGNQWFLLLGAGSAPQQVPPQAVGSVSSGGSNCFNAGFQGPLDVYPVQEVLPLDPVGIAPFYLR